MSAVETLQGLDFEDKGTEEFQALSDQLGLSENYPHKVLGVYTRGDITAVLEQNVSEDNQGGVMVIMKHPPVLILESPKGRVAVTTIDDAELIKTLVNDLS